MKQGLKQFRKIFSLEAHISVNLPPNNTVAYVESTGANIYMKSNTATFFADARSSRRGRRRGECVGVRRRGVDGCTDERGATGTDSGGRVTGTES